MNAHYTMDLALTKELQRLRQQEANAPDTSKGMALIFCIGDNEYMKDRPVGIFTVAFAEAWCASDPAYRWERI